MRENQRLNILVGVLGLTIGTLLYLVDRPPEQIYFIYNTNNNLSLYNKLPNIFGVLGNWLPTFFHPFSFILLTAGIISSKKKHYMIICLFWFSVNMLFELGQKYKIIAIAFIPDWFKGIPYLENSKNYFLNGKFDIFDVTAIIVGSTAAYAILLITDKRSN